MHIYITLLQIEQDMIGKTQIAIKFENIFIEWFFPPLHYTKTWSFLSGTLQKYSSSSEKKFEKKISKQIFFVLELSHKFTYFTPKKYFKFWDDKFSVTTWVRQASITTPCCARSPGHTKPKRRWLYCFVCYRKSWKLSVLSPFVC